jgi:AmmeMemoRadiSam system protein A
MSDELLTADERRTLLTLARRAIQTVLLENAIALPDDSTLVGRMAQPGASFVTLRMRADDDLRGCTGTTEATQPLALNVCYVAVQTALYDPRFPPLSAFELEDVEIEVSVLSEPQPLRYSTLDELLRLLLETRPGVLIKRDSQRATFLPQVWERLPDPVAFLAHLCVKAGLPAEDYLRPGLQIMTYHVEKFSESEVFPVVSRQ